MTSFADTRFFPMERIELELREWILEYNRKHNGLGADVCKCSVVAPDYIRDIEDELGKLEGQRLRMAALISTVPAQELRRVRRECEERLQRLTANIRITANQIKFQCGKCCLSPELTDELLALQIDISNNGDGSGDEEEREAAR